MRAPGSRRRGPLGGRLRGAPALLLWLAAGCEALVDGQLQQVYCEAEGTVGPPACPLGLTCKDGACVETHWGASCATDADCMPSELCLDPRALGGEGARQCSRPCCTSSDCDPDGTSVCWVPPVGGGSFCRAAAEVGRASGGTGAPLATCEADADCRSGLCDEGRCVDTCCSDTSCAPGGVCTLAGPPTREALGFWCGQAPGTASPYGPCAKDADCASGLCLDFGLKQPVCSVPCCGSNDCTPLDGLPARCVMLPGPHAGVRACFVGMPTGPGEVGVSCTKDADCRSGMCEELAGRLQCTDFCCTDASCGAPAAYVCRPSLVGSAWALRCEPK